MKRPALPRAIRVIQSMIVRGNNENNEPWRDVIQYHTFDGEFLAERDDFIEDQRLKKTLMVYRCGECLGEFDTLELLNDHFSQSGHIGTAHMVDEYMSINTLIDQLDTMRRKFNASRTPQERTQYKENIQMHAQALSDELRKTFMCHECKQVFRTLSYLNKHLLETSHEHVG